MDHRPRLPNDRLSLPGNHGEFFVFAFVAVIVTAILLAGLPAIFLDRLVMALGGRSMFFGEKT